MPFTPHHMYSGVYVKEPFLDGEEDYTNYHAYLTMDDWNNIHMEVEEHPGGNTEIRILKNEKVIWSHELITYILPILEGIAYAVGIREGMQLDLPNE